MHYAKKSSLIFIVTLFYFTNTWAMDRQCIRYLDSRPNLILSFSDDIIPMQGLIIQTARNEIILALGPYLTSNHEGLLYSLKFEKRHRLKSILWAGEVFVSKIKGNYILYGSNDTSEFLTDIRARSLGLGGSDFETNSFLNGVEFFRNDKRHLQRFSKAKGFYISKSYFHISSDLTQQSLVDLRQPMDAKQKLEFSNKVSNLIVAVDSLSQNLPISFDDTDLINILKVFKAYVLDYLEYNLVEDPKALEKMNLFLQTVDSVISESNGLAGLGPEKLTTLYGQLIFVTKQVLRPSNPIIQHEIKIQKK